MLILAVIRVVLNRGAALVDEVVVTKLIAIHVGILLVVFIEVRAAT